MVRKDENYINLTQEKVQWWTLVNTLMKLLVR